MLFNHFSSEPVHDIRIIFLFLIPHILCPLAQPLSNFLELTENTISVFTLINVWSCSFVFCQQTVKSRICCFLLHWFPTRLDILVEELVASLSYCVNMSRPDHLASIFWLDKTLFPKLCKWNHQSFSFSSATLIVC